ncbi:hypothetical protein WJX74_005670 [Apatococcus lobatus]|uniref:ATP-dependent Clp protease proteolytic subunit n=1 Tax=Apatococcus lobatus TaxID=904363 RepID=A0AAW1SFM3_9CHLO
MAHVGLLRPTCVCPPSRRTKPAFSVKLPVQYAGFQSVDRFPCQPLRDTSTCFWTNTSRACAGARQSNGPRRRVTQMPIGVPKVPYRSAQAGGWQWIDIWNCLYRERIIFLSKAVDEELGNQLVATMLYLDSENKKDMQLYINCSGGEVVPCLALHDTMRHIGSSVATVGFGGCMGMSGFMLAVGAKGKRYLLPNTRVMLHHPSGTARGQATDIHNEARELMRLRNYVNNVLSNATGQPLPKVQHDFNRNKFFDAQEAKDYGIVDQIIRPPRSQSLGV